MSTTAGDKEISDAPKGVNPERFALIQEIAGRETSIDQLAADDITKAYAVYETDPNRIIEVVVSSFKSYCRKCMREAAIIKVKNELATMYQEEAERLRNKVTDEMYAKIKADHELEQLIMMLLFKNYYWNWIKYGLKDIFNDQRMQPGHEINTYLNARFHRLKTAKNFKMVGDLVTHDIIQIVNSFKNEIIAKKVKIF